MEYADTWGVLLMAYGTPATLDDVEPYYTHIRHGRKPPAELLTALKERYAFVGGHTPLREITAETRARLERHLRAGGAPVRVYLGMKHWHPYIEQAVGEMARDGITHAVGLVLAPHYSSRSIAEYYGYVDAAQAKIGSEIAIERITSWHLHPPYLAAVARRVRDKLREFPPGAEVTVLFTAHSLPRKILENGDPYPAQLAETARALAGMLALPRWTFSYQSAGRTADPWLGPDILETVSDLAGRGVRHLLVAPIGFVSDHLEILYDIDHEARQAARERGITLLRTESLNASDDFVEGLAALVRTRMPTPGPASVCGRTGL